MDQQKQMIVSVVVHPGSKKPRIERDTAGMLHVYVNEPARENKANDAVIAALTTYFAVKKSQVHLHSGAKSKMKQFTIQ